MELEEDDDILYGISAPARNVPELTVATLALIQDLQEQTDEKEVSYIIKHLDTYGKQNPLPPISFRNINLEWFNVSEPLTFEDLDSHIVVLDFFTYCCINCLHILPDLEALEEKYKPNNSPVLVIGIHTGKFDNEHLTKCVADATKKNCISHPVANDIKCKLWEDLDISCWPTLLIVGPGGVPLFVLVGEGKKDFLFNFVDETIKYFEGIRELDPKPLPLTPSLHLPSKDSDLYYPGKVGIFHKGLIISDSGNNRIVLTTWDGKVKDIIGCGKKGLEDGCFSSASFNNPHGVAFHPSGVIFVADTDNHAIRKINLESKTVETVAGTGCQGADKRGGLLWKEQAISSPWDVCLGHTLDASSDSPPNLLFITMAGLHQIWGLFLTGGQWLKKCFYPEGTVVRLAGNGLEENRNTSYPLKAGFAQPSGIAICGTSEGEIAFIADSESSSIRQFSFVSGAVKNVAGGGIDPTDLFTYGDQDGTPDVARFQHPLGVAAFADKIYVADSYNHKIKLLRKQNNTFITETILGVGQPGDVNANSNIPMLNEPGGLCISQDGKYLFIADTNNFCIKEYNTEERKTRRIELKILSSSNIEEPSEDRVDSKEYLIFFLPHKKVKVNLKLILNLPDHVHLTPEANQKYSLACSGDICVQQLEGTVDYETNVSLEVDLSINESARVTVSSKLFLCFNEGKCTMKEVLTMIKFLRNENETKDDINVDVEVKPEL